MLVHVLRKMERKQHAYVMVSVVLLAFLLNIYVCSEQEISFCGQYLTCLETYL
jgi:hypothetical protein